MVCHETYKIDNQWLNPNDVYSKNGKDYYLKDNPNKKVEVGPSESMSKSKNTIDPEIMIKNYGADAVRFFILSIVLLKKMYSGQIKECKLLINLSKNFGN